MKSKFKVNDEVLVDDQYRCKITDVVKDEDDGKIYYECYLLNGLNIPRWIEESKIEKLDQ